MKRISSIWIAVLGVAVGALAVLAYDSYSQKKNLIRVQYGDWRKLNLILDQIDRNYVDTINVNDVTEAAITAALAELDPHSVYMPTGASCLWTGARPPSSPAARERCMKH